MAEPTHEEPLLSDGNPVRLRALVPLIFGTLLGIISMASAGSARVVLPISMVAVALVVFGSLDLIGSFDDEADHTVSARDLLLPAATTVGATSLLFLLFRLAVNGNLSVFASASLIPTTFIGCVAALHWLGARLGPWSDRKLTERHGFWLVVLATLIYMPMLGNHGLWDPWETHYGEVAREILARNDWISLWWAQDGWFWSKPVLSFWMQAAAMALCGVRYESGEMLAAVGDGAMPRPEWPLRMTVFLAVIVGVHLLYKAVARSHGRRAGFLGGMVLLTMPQFFLLAHQTMTDMPFAAFMAAAVGALLLAMHSDDEERVRVYEVRAGSKRIGLSLFHVVVAAMLFVVVPQVLYLLSRNVSFALSPHFDIRFVGDTFSAGSPLNCGLPGNSACSDGLQPVTPRFEPVVQALLWLQCMALVLWLEWGERRTKRLLYLAAWFFVSLSTMAKGPAGVGLPVLAALAWVVATGRYRELTRMEIIAGLLVFMSMVFPWFVAMYVRHGQPFTDRLLFHDMFKRAFRHVHDTNPGEDLSFRYYVWQLGYATFPWVGLVPVALVRWLRRRRDGMYTTELTMAAWFVIGFALFSMMGTKFHHYSLPILPPLAMLTGILLDDLMRREPKTDAALLGAAALGAAALTLVVGRDIAHDVPGGTSQARLLQLVSYNYTRVWPEGVDFGTALWGFTLTAVCCTAALAMARVRDKAAMGLAATCAAFAAWGINIYMVDLSPHWGQRELFVAYEHQRVEQPGPLIAYQLNWKGENFYRGNSVAAFVSSGKPMEDWIDAQKKEGARVFYFVTEHKRVSSLRRELGDPHELDELTDVHLNNKFLLVRARF
jgi:4-amino-4-deoxy-L-arabinose transferase-like glycosyltransferase